MKLFKNVAINLSIIVLLISMTSCLSNKVIRLADYELFKLGQQQFNAKKFIKSRETFTLLIDYYPDSKFTGDAQLMKADAFFKEHNYLEAGVEYNLFIQFHPAHPRADYALYQEAECTFKHVRSIDREQTEINETVKKLKQLISLYPTSKFVPLAKSRLKECFSLINQHSLYVAKFYYHWGEYKSSITRYQNMLKSTPKPDEKLTIQINQGLIKVKDKYKKRLLFVSAKAFKKKNYAQTVAAYEELFKIFPEIQKKEKLLFQLATSYIKVEKKDDANKYLKMLLKDYPKGTYSKKASVLLNTLKTEIKTKEEKTKS